MTNDVSKSTLPQRHKPSKKRSKPDTRDSNSSISDTSVTFEKSTVINHHINTHHSDGITLVHSLLEKSATGPHQKTSSTHRKPSKPLLFDYLEPNLNSILKTCNSQTTGTVNDPSSKLVKTNNTPTSSLFTATNQICNHLDQYANANTAPSHEESPNSKLCKSVSFQDDSFRVKDDAVDLWRQARSAISSAEKAKLRSNHLKQLAEDDNLPGWALGLQPIPQHIIPESSYQAVVQQVKEAGKRILNTMSQELRDKYCRDTAKGNALIISVEHVYGENSTDANKALSLLAGLVQKDRDQMTQLLSKKRAEVTENPIDDEAIKNKWFQSKPTKNHLQNNPNTNRRLRQNRSRSRGRRPPTNRPNRGSNSRARSPSTSNRTRSRSPAHKANQKTASRGQPMLKQSQKKSQATLNLTEKERALIMALRQ